VGGKVEAIGQGGGGNDLHGELIRQTGHRHYIAGFYGAFVNAYLVRTAGAFHVRAVGVNDEDVVAVSGGVFDLVCTVGCHGYFIKHIGVLHHLQVILRGADTAKVQPA